MGYAEGTLSCRSDCKLDISLCEVELFPGVKYPIKPAKTPLFIIIGLIIVVLGTIGYTFFRKTKMGKGKKSSG